MMSTITIQEEKLEEFIGKAVQEHLDLTFKDMEVVRRSPAAAIIRLEEKVEQLVTRSEFSQAINWLEEKLSGKIGNPGEIVGSLGEKVGNLEGVVAGIKSTQKLLISLYLSLLGLVGAMFVRMFFF